MTLEVSTGGAQSGHGPGRLARGRGLGEGRTLEKWSPGLSEQMAHTRGQNPHRWAKSPEGSPQVHARKDFV